MRIDLDSGDSRDYEIRSYEPHKLTINENIYQSSIILTPISIIPWETQKIVNFSSNDVQLILGLNPEIVLIGTGEKLIFPPIEITNLITSKNIGTEIMTTSAACRTYNVLLSEGRHVVAALIV